MKRVFLFLTAFLFIGWNAQALQLYLLSNHKNVGDHNQALGVARALEGLAHHKVFLTDIDTSTTAPSEIKEKVEKGLKDEKVLIVGTGEGGLKGIKELSPNPNLIICLASHMFLEGYRNDHILQKVNFIALPTHASAKYKEMLGPKLIPTTGVAHNRQVGTIEKAYKKWGNSELPPCKSYLTVVLGGDAPTPQNEIRLFTVQEAVKLADRVSQEAKGSCVVVLNGPRTGKHDLKKNEIPTAHKDGKLDNVTQAFKTRLEQKLNSEKVKVFDFQHDQKLPYNAFDIALGATKATHNKAFIPGESTSMVSEASDLLPPGKVVVYENGAMNEAHYAHIQSELEAGHIVVLENYTTLQTPPKSVNKSQASAAITIAERLMETVKS